MLTESQNSEKIQEVKRKQLPVSNGTIKIVEGNKTVVVVQSLLGSN